MDISKKIELPSGAGLILQTLERHGHEAFIVGGCVRDSVMGRTPGDWDITTSASPEGVKQLFSKTYDTGIKHGTVTVVADEVPYEVTTYRIEGKYDDHRRPSQVTFTKNIEEDLKRRDFTINAMAYHPERGFVDPFGGLKDLDGKVIRCVGDAGERFQEDALRMMRAVRFSAQLDFEIDQDTLKAISLHSRLIQMVSMERIREELNKTLVSDYPGRFILLHRTGILKLIIPEFERCLETYQNNPYHIFNVGLHSMKAVEAIEKDPVLRWTMLLHDTGKPLSKTTDEKGIDHFHGHEMKSTRLAEGILKKLRFDNKSIDRILRLIRWHDRPVEPTFKAVRRAVRTVGEDIFPDLLKVKEADIKSQNPDFAEDRLRKLGEIHRIYGEIKNQNQCVSKEGLAVTGHDLIAEGVKEGRMLGIILDQLLDLVIESPEMNTREKLLEKVRERM